MNSPLPYVGGKSKLSRYIVSLFPKDHTCYCEPFSGAAWILFAKGPSKVEVINDRDGDLVTFWRVIQNHLQPFLEYFKYSIISRKLFELENRKDPLTLTDIQRAVRYYYLQRLCFGGKVDGRTFGTSATQPGRLNLTCIEETLLDVHWRLERVTIENIDGVACIERYDRPETLFYIDPPYHHVSQGYAHKFSDSDFDRLRVALSEVKGRFILSLNDSPAVRSMFDSFKIRTVTLKYSVGNARSIPGTRSTPRNELIISNF